MKIILCCSGISTGNDIEGLHLNEVWFYTAYTAYNDTPHDVQRDGNGQIILVTNCIYVGLSQISPLQIRAKDIRYRFSQIKFPNRNTSSLKIKTIESQNHSRAYELIRPARREASSE